MLDAIWDFFPKILFILSGISVTLEYSIISLFFGIILGFALAISKVSNKSLLRLSADCYTSIFRGTPLLIQLSIIYFALPGLIGVKLSMLTAGCIAFSLNSGAYVSEVIRAGINSIDKGQFEAAKALGISDYLIMKDIILPQAIKNIFPSLINELINLIKESAIISMIGEMDLMRRAQVVSAESYRYFEPMLVAGCGYYFLILVISVFGKYLEKRIKD